MTLTVAVYLPSKFELRRLRASGQWNTLNCLKHKSWTLFRKDLKVPTPLFDKLVRCSVHRHPLKTMVNVETILFSVGGTPDSTRGIDTAVVVAIVCIVVFLAVLVVTTAVAIYIYYKRHHGSFKFNM